MYSLLGAAVQRGDISETEAVGLAGPLQIGGEAVTHNCGQMLYLLLTRPELLERLPGLRLAVPPDQVVWRRRTMIRGPQSLPCAW